MRVQIRVSHPHETKRFNHAWSSAHDTGMERPNRFNRALLASCALGALACDQSATSLDSAGSPLVVECVGPEDLPGLPPDAWVCPAPRTVACTGGTGTVEGGTLYVEDPGDAACLARGVVVSNDGPYPVGEHTISVSLEGGAAPICSTTLTVVDNVAPVLTSHTIQLWPPNHKFHEIAVSDCVSFVDACSGAVTGEFIWASSDEPVDDKGDGHHAPDIQLSDCGKIAVRSERAGPRDGRVYTLGVRVVDQGGNESVGTCKVIVDHDQRGVQGADDGESYRITFDGSQGGPVCDGVVPPPVNPPVNPPPSDDTPPGDTPPGDTPPTMDPPPAPPVQQPPAAGPVI